MPIDQREWNDILAVGYIDEESFNVSKTMIRILMHRGLHREKDGASGMENIVAHVLCREHRNAPRMDE